MKGIILAGGEGTRLHPVTLAISKQLIPIYNKPLIYYPLATLMLAGVKDILIITKQIDLELFKNLLGNGSQFGLNINFEVQKKSNGIPEALIIGKKFIGSESVALILGDNFFYGSGIGRSLNVSQTFGAKIFLKEVANPNNFGVLELNPNGSPKRIIEKPIKTESNLAVTGLYIYSNKVVELASTLKPSERGETEITDLNNIFLYNNELETHILPRSTVWFDTGTFEGIHNASEFVRIIEAQQQINVGDPKEIAKLNGWI
jgi:glucose-1-phosphate thymidylyltransferase